MKVGIIIVNYNKRELLKNCLESLFVISYKNIKILVVDNGSEDDSCSLVKNEFPSVDLIKMGYNSSFCKANNYGIKKCLEDGCDAVVLLNNDTVVAKDFLTNMIAVLNKNRKTGMVAARILFMNNRKIIDSAGLEITRDGLAKNRGLNENFDKYTLSDEVFCPAGAAAFYTKELLEDIEDDGQYFDEKFEYYFEELDLGWRARLKGWKCVYAPDSVVYHLKSATSGAYSEFVAFYTNRNIFFNIIKNYPSHLALKALGLTLIRYVFLLIGGFSGQGPADKIKKIIGPFNIVKVCFMGWIDVIKFLPVLLKQRMSIKKEMRVSMNEVDRWFLQMGLSFFKSIYK